MNKKPGKHFRQDVCYKHAQMRASSGGLGMLKSWGWVLRCNFCNKFLSPHKIHRNNDECYHCNKNLGPQ